MKRLTLLTREGCELCEEFERELRVHFPAVELQHADVDSRDEWRRRYGLRIPVLLDEWGEVLAEGRFEPAALKG